MFYVKFHLTFFDVSLLKMSGKCTALFKTHNERIPYESKRIQLFKIVAFLFQFGIYCTVCYKLSMRIMRTIFDVSIEEKRVYGS